MRRVFFEKAGAALNLELARPSSVGIAVRLKAVSRRFDKRAIISELELEIRAGEFVALLGASGSGKTTLLRLLAGIDAPDEGEVWVPEARTVVFQEPRLVQSLKVWRNVVVGLSGEAAQRERAQAALAEVGLNTHVDNWPVTLSGGEAQRVALARALVRQPDLLLLDEPFASLDALTRLKMQQLVRELCLKHSPATLLVTHDVDEAIVLADRILVLSHGRISFDKAVNMPHPRHAASHAFATLRDTLLSELGIEAVL
jgi:sulfonate transport system ATP-binding protein